MIWVTMERGRKRYAEHNYRRYRMRLRHRVIDEMWWMSYAKLGLLTFQNLPSSTGLIFISGPASGSFVK